MAPEAAACTSDVEEKVALVVTVVDMRPVDGTLLVFLVGARRKAA